ncbi:MAG: SGNH/GDSL hydrolase family protein [Candidatus Methylomirabilia bacterium]
MRTSACSAIRTRAGGLALALALVIAGGGCHSGGSSVVDEVDPNRTNDRSVILALGDSITFGVFDTNVENCSQSNRFTGGFCPPLAALLDKTVVNAGVCGEDSSGGVERVDGLLRRFRPSVILIDYSPNDLFFGAETVIANLRFMIDAARNNRTVPVIGTLVPATSYHSGWNPFIVDVNNRILALCVEQGLECADHHQAFADDAGFQASPYALLSEDGLHPNHAGYALMAETWYRSVRRVY